MDVATGQVPPSRLIAEALVLGHDSVVVKERAAAMGLPESLTSAVVSVCCREQRDCEQASRIETAP
jgi:hypothetical protein